MSSEKQKAKDRAWYWFSRFIRLRDCIKTTGTDTHCICITCDTKKTFQETHAGHFVDGRSNSVLFEEDLVNGQCGKCNTFLHGNHSQYVLKMIDLHGRDWVDEKLALKHQIIKMSAKDYRAKADEYRRKYNDLSKLDPAEAMFSLGLA